MAVAISNMGATWNTSPSSVNTAIKMNVIDTSSAATSKLLDLQVGSTSKFVIDKAGNMSISGNASISGSAYITGLLGVGTSSAFTGTTTFTNAHDPIISQDGGFVGGGLYYDSGWKNSSAGQGGWAIRNSGGVFTLYTGPANGAVGSTINASERVRVTADGAVGIGMTPSNGKLDVQGRGRFVQESATTTGAVILRQTSGDTYGGVIQWVDNGNANQKGYLQVDTGSNAIFGGVNSLLVSGSIRTAYSLNFGPNAGNYQPGSIYSDGNWGAIFRCAQTTPVIAHFTLQSAADATLMRIDAGGNTGFGTSLPKGKIEATGEITSQLTGYGNFRAIAGGYGAFYRNDGADFYTLLTDVNDQYGQWNALRPFQIALSTGLLTSQTTYDNTTAAGSAVHISATGILRRSSSSIKYKKDVENLYHDLADNAIANLRPVWYRSKEAVGDDKETWSHIGLIAEEVHLVEPRLVVYRTERRIPGENGESDTSETLEVPEPEDVNYARLSVLLLDVVQRQTAKIADLEARLTALENNT